MTVENILQSSQTDVVITLKNSKFDTIGNYLVDVVEFDNLVINNAPVFSLDTYKISNNVAIKVIVIDRDNTFTSIMNELVETDNNIVEEV